jgi:hypothetical protein
MEKMRNNILQKMLMRPEEVEAYAEPSVMDEYIRKEDPEQYEKIARAKNIQDALNMSATGGGAMGTIGRAKDFSQIVKLFQQKNPAYKDAIKNLSQEEKQKFSDYVQSIGPKYEMPQIDTQSLATRIPGGVDEKIGNVIFKPVTPESVGNVIIKPTQDKGFGNILRLIKEKKIEKPEHEYSESAQAVLDSLGIKYK